MDCRDVRPLLHPYSDGELDLVHVLRIEHHLAECTTCADREQGLRRLREVVASARLDHPAPAALRRNVLAALDAEVLPAPAARTRRWPVWEFAGLAAGVMFAVSAALLAAGWGRTDSTGRLADQVAASHVRSLQVAHLTDVPSSDRHTVKPWFGDKLDFSPRVPDLTAGGFTLTGGRLDYLADRPVAAIVYRRRQHVINLFTWPSAEAPDRAARSLHRQGFHFRHWQQHGMTYWAVSDLNPHELAEFVERFQGHDAPP